MLFSEVEAVRQSNLTRGAEYKAELEEMKEMAAQQREEWMQFGHELTVQHGPEQAERTKARLAETAEAKVRALARRPFVQSSPAGPRIPDAFPVL